jgi:hypothetical protein
MKYFFEECINFVSMHYSKTERTEKFWKVVRETIKKSEEQIMYEQQLLDPTVPMARRPKAINFFTGHNWNTWLIQMGYPISSKNVDESSEESLRLLLNNYYRETEKSDNGILHSFYVDKIINQIN